MELGTGETVESFRVSKPGNSRLISVVMCWKKSVSSGMTLWCSAHRSRSVRLNLQLLALRTMARRFRHKIRSTGTSQDEAVTGDSGKERERERERAMERMDLHIGSTAPCVICMDNEEESSTVTMIIVCYIKICSTS